VAYTTIDVSYHIATLIGPTPTVSLAMATDLQPPMDVVINHRVMGLPLAPKSPVRVCHFWFTARRCAARASWSAHGCVRDIGGVAWPQYVGDRTRHRIPLCWRILPSHGCWDRLGAAGAYVQSRDGASCGWDLGLVVDYGVDDCLGDFFD
jgi:hypothetical protein